MRARALFPTAILALLLGGCVDRGDLIGPLKPSLVAFVVEDPQNVTLTLRVDNVGPNALTRPDAFVSPEYYPKGLDSWRGNVSPLAQDPADSTGAFVHDLGVAFNYSDVIGPHESRMLDFRFHYPEPLPATTQFGFRLDAVYAENGHEWMWTWDMPCFDMQSRSITAPDSGSCEGLSGRLSNRIRVTALSLPWEFV